MNGYNKPDVTRASKKIQEYIVGLERDIAALEKERAEASSGYPGTNVRQGNYGMGPDIMLPPNSEVDFYLDNPVGDKFRGNTISVRHHGKNSDTVIVASSGGRLVVSPIATNSLTIKMENW